MAKASPVKRILAYLVDYVLVLCMVILFMGVIGFGGSFLMGMLAAALRMGFLAVLAFPLVMIGGALSVICMVGYSLFKDGLFGGRSFGKKLLKLKVVTKEGKPCDYVKSLLRNIVYIIPFMLFVELIMLFVDKDGERIGDKIAGTRVEE